MGNTSIKELTTIGKKYAKLRALHAKMKADAAKIWSDIEALEEEVRELLLTNEMRNMQIDGVGKFVISSKSKCSILPEYKDDVRDWLIKSKDSALNKMLLTVNSQTIGSTLRQQLDALTEAKRKQLASKMKELGIAFETFEALTFTPIKTKK